MEFDVAMSEDDISLQGDERAAQALDLFNQLPAVGFHSSGV